MDARELQARLLPTPFFSALVGRCREGDLYDHDPNRRAAAWAQWAMTGLTQMTGLSERSYPALTLPGRFYDPKGTGPSVRPHLEIPAHVIERSGAEFPDRLALMGNGLTFAWWVVSEVTAVRRALFNTPKGPVSELVDRLNERRTALVDTLGALTRTAAPEWSVIEGLLISSPDGLSSDAAGDFSEEEVAEFFPAGADLGLRVVYDPRLREKNRQWASRRTGVWQIHGTSETGQRFALGVITPRLTANSLFHDSHFAAEREAAGALLVRGLLLRRLISRHLSGDAGTRVSDATPVTHRSGGPHLRAVVARVGAKLPEASMEAAVHFLQTYPDADAAWEALSRWAANGHLLTVTEEGHKSAHRNALRFVRRAEDPERDDVNVVLPLAWDERSRVVRVTFSKPPPEEPTAE